MTLQDSRFQRTMMLCAMYFAQGVPWGFMTIALATYLAGRGVPASEVGWLSAMVLLPWTFKLIWAPLIDSVTIRSMGRRRPWIIGAEFCMALSLGGILMLGDLTQHLWMLGGMFFLHNCFAALQDVATDALAVDVLLPEEQGLTNGLMWGSKLVGKGLGGAVLGYVLGTWGLTPAVVVQFVVLLFIMLFPILMLERCGEKLLPGMRSKSEGKVAGTSFRNPFAVGRDLVRAFSLVATFVLFVFATINLIGWGIVEVITKTLYTQQLGWSVVDVSGVSGFAVVPELAGAVIGGLVADRIGRRVAMIVGFSGYGLLAIVFGANPHLWQESWFTTGYLLVNPFFLAVGSVGFLSMAMRISWTTAAATVFTIFMTVSNIGHVVGNGMIGLLRVHLELSYQEMFWFAGISMLLPLVLLIVVRPESVDVVRDFERKASAS